MTRHLSGPVGPIDSRGEPYITLAGGSLKPEGDAVHPKELRADPAEAWGLFLESFHRLTADADVVEWRTLPTPYQMGQDDDRYVVRARFSAYKLPAGAEAARDALNNGSS